MKINVFSKKQNIIKMENSEVLHEYSDSIKRLKIQCENQGMTEEEFKTLYFESLRSLKNNRPTDPSGRFLTKYRILLAGITILVCAFYNYKSICSSLQEYIYPGLKLLRKLSIPVISLFPTLADLYHDTCLIQNPFFTVVDMDCWPCSTVSNVREVYDPKSINQQNGAPFIYETEQQSMTIESLKSLYIKNKKLFDKESPKILVNNKYHISSHDLFHKERLAEDKKFYIWKFNNMDVARLLRHHIPKPKIVPKFGQSTERFIIIDTSQASFHVPDTECNFSFLLSVSGSRHIHLNPAEECKHQCKILKVELKESYLLWYNWWYWRPVVQPSTGNNTLIAHVGSYC